MALNVPDGDVIVAFAHTLAGWSKPLVCTIGVGVDPGEPLDTGSANDMFGWWAGDMKESVCANLTFVSATLYQKQPLGYVPFVSDAASVVGVSSGASLPPNTAVMINKNTGRPGRSGRGRMFLPGVSEGLIDANGALQSALRTQLAADLAQFIGHVTGSGQFDDLLLYHDEDNISPTPTIITSLSADARVSSIAKRFKRSA